MRIRTKLVTVFLGIAILFTAVGYYGVQYTARVGALFQGVESDSVPSLISLMEIIAATRQASIKAMEHSMRGRSEDQEKAFEALQKIQDGLASYKATMLDQGPAKAQDLDNKVSRFVREIESYLSFGTGPVVSGLIMDVDRLHEFRSDLIRAVNAAIQHATKPLELTLQNIKSEARKVSIKSVEFALHGNSRANEKAEEALANLSAQLHRFEQYPEARTDFGQAVLEKGSAYTEIARRYLDQVMTSKISVKDIHEKEKKVHHLRRELIHALYPLIAREKEEFRSAADETHASIANAVYILVGSVTGVVLLALVAGFLVARSITKPLQKLNEASQHVAKGDLNQELGIQSADELGELAVSFEHMRKELKNHSEHMEELVKERTNALEASNKELESYSYSIAHDLRAPLRSITGFSQIILEDAGDKLDSVDKGYLQRIVKSAAHMAELIDDILELSRVSRTEMQFDEVDLSEICSEIGEALSTANPDRKVEWRIQPGLKVKGDRGLLYMVLSNLLGNAWKFTQQRSPAVIEFCMENNNGNVYCVRDNGVGFDMNYASKLFGLFRRLHRPEEYEGTGVGLATVQRIVHRHNGWVRAEGEIDKGATVCFSIPGISDSSE